VPPKPSWRRSIRRSAPWGAGIFVVIVFFFKGNSLASRIILALVYAAAFIPLTYWVDRVVYRNYQRRLERGKR
jgi:predicted PurR-regulated permease PerM